LFSKVVRHVAPTSSLVEKGSAFPNNTDVTMYQTVWTTRMRTTAVRVFVYTANLLDIQKK